MEKLFLGVTEVCEILGVSRAKAYGIMRELNDELAKQGYMVIRGKVNEKFFIEKFYGYKAAEEHS